MNLKRFKEQFIPTKLKIIKVVHLVIEEIIQKMSIRVFYEINPPNAQQKKDDIKPIIKRQDIEFANEEVAEFIAQFEHGIPVILNFLSTLDRFFEVVRIDQDNYEFKELNFTRSENNEQDDNLEFFLNYNLFQRYFGINPAPGMLIELWLTPRDIRMIATCYTELLPHVQDLNGYLIERIESALGLI